MEDVFMKIDHQHERGNGKAMKSSNPLKNNRHYCILRK